MSVVILSIRDFYFHSNYTHRASASLPTSSVAQCYCLQWVAFTYHFALCLFSFGVSAYKKGISHPFSQLHVPRQPSHTGPRYSGNTCWTSEYEKLYTRISRHATTMSLLKEQNHYKTWLGKNQPWGCQSVTHSTVQSIAFLFKVSDASAVIH